MSFKFKKQNKLVQKKCQYDGCGKDYVGHAISKYCKFHRDVKNREVKKHETINNNLIINYSNNKITVEEFTCSLEGCNNKYTIELIPRQNVYPKYCPDHRNEFKRKNFKKT